MANSALSEAESEKGCYRIRCAADKRMQVSVMQTSAERTAVSAIVRS